MKNLALAAQGGQELNQDHRKSKFSKKYPSLPIGNNRQIILNELAIKWVRFGCCDTPNEAMRVLLGEVNHGQVRPLKKAACLDGFM